MTVEIHTNTDGKGTVAIINDSRRYTVFYDEYTGDWGVSCQSDDTIQSPWFRSKDGAVQWILQHLSVLDEAKYEFAPDRC